MERRSRRRAGLWTAGVAAVLVLLCPATAWADPAAGASVTAAASAPAPAPPAFHEAADLGRLTMDPASGATSSTLVTVRTAAACPAASTSTVVYLLGPTGSPADTTRVMVAGAPATDTASGPVARVLSGDLASIARTSGAADLVPGRYRLVLQCGEALAAGQFSGELSVSNTQAWQALPTVSASASPSPSATSSATPVTLPPVSATLLPTTAAPSTADAPSTTPSAGAVPPLPSLTATTPGAAGTDGATAGTAGGIVPAVTPSSTVDAVGSTPAPASTAAIGATADAFQAAVGAGAAANARVRVLLDSSPVLGTLDLTVTDLNSQNGPAAVTSGTADQKFGVKPTPGGSVTRCPSGTVTYQATVNGPGAAWQTALEGGANLGSPHTDLLATFSDGAISSFAAYARSYGLTIEPGTYTLAVVCYSDNAQIASIGQFTRDVYFVTATQWQLGDPATTTTATTITISADPAVRQTLGGPVKLTATVTPSTAVGAVQFQQVDNSGGRADFPAKAQASDPSTAVPLQNGTATYTTSTLAVALYPFAAAFVPTDPQKFTTSSTGDVIQVAVVPPLPPTPGGAAVLSGTPSVGSTLTCAATFTAATSTGWAWIRDYDTVLEATGSTYAVVAEDKGHTLRCRALATNAGGTISRTSAALAVPA